MLFGANKDPGSLKHMKQKYPLRFKSENFYSCDNTTKYFFLGQYIL